VLAYAAWQGLRFIIDRHTRPLGPPGEVSAPGSRLHTLLPLLRNFILIVLVVLATLIVLSSLGIDIGPLLAGAGVVGLAIGFGAQTLVRDIVSGIFFLIDDAFRIGEYVEIGSLRGTVEGMSLRSIKLRHHRGHLHTIPFGELASLTNYSRDWVIMKLELNLTYDTDIEKVKKLLKRIGAEMKADPELGPHILEPLKSQGITQMGDFALMVRAKFMAKPGEQFVIRREAYRRIKETFEANGIKFAYPTVTIHQPGTLGPEAAAGIAAAAGLDRPEAEPGASAS
jgi:small-conductance mechanosensitive channel